jgi:preprotein translocase subunit SecA
VDGALYNWLGLSIGVIVNGQSDAEKRRSYLSDICYGQNNEFGFDYLRDNMKFSALDYVQRPLNYAIVDEVDSILIDEARTPLIISGPADAASEKYRVLNEVVTKLRKDEHYTVDEKGHSATFTDEGVEHVQNWPGSRNLYDPAHIQTLHILNQCSRSRALQARPALHGVSGRQDPDHRRVHRACAARSALERRAAPGRGSQGERADPGREPHHGHHHLPEPVPPLQEAGRHDRHGETEAQEFSSTYKLDVVVIPTNQAMVRERSPRYRLQDRAREVHGGDPGDLEQNELGRPVLVGTTSVEKSGAISRILEKKGVKHHVLNAKHHENEAFVVAQAGRKGAITVSTNMAGRGTDIMLGGNPEMLARLGAAENRERPWRRIPRVRRVGRQVREVRQTEHDEVVELGGLHILGTERHESRRIDNQLRGRAGRQGDPGSSRFYLSLEDDLMRIFAGDRVKNLMDRMGMPDDEPIEHPGSPRASRTPSARSRSATSTSASTCSSTTT